MSERERVIIAEGEARRQKAKEDRAKNRNDFIRKSTRVLIDHGDFMLPYNHERRVLFTDPVGVMYKDEAMVKMDLEQVTKEPDGESLVTETTTTINITIPHSRDRKPIFTVTEYVDKPDMFTAPTDRGTKVINGEGKVASNDEVAEAAGYVESMREKLDNNRRF